MLRIPDSPEDRQGEDGIRPGFQCETRPVQGREQWKISALLHTGREDDIGQVRFHQGLCLVQVIQVTVVKWIVFRNNAEDCHTGFLLFSKGGYGVSVAF